MVCQALRPPPSAVEDRVTPGRLVAGVPLPGRVRARGGAQTVGGVLAADAEVRVWEGRAYGSIWPLVPGGAGDIHVGPDGRASLQHWQKASSGSGSSRGRPRSPCLPSEGTGAGVAGTLPHTAPSGSRRRRVGAQRGGPCASWGLLEAPAPLGATSHPRRPPAPAPGLTAAQQHRASCESRGQPLLAQPDGQPPLLPSPPVAREVQGRQKCHLSQGAVGPVFASIDVKICQEFNGLLVKIHCWGLWLPPPGTSWGSVTSLAGSAPTVARASLEKQQCPALEEPLP